MASFEMGKDFDIEWGGRYFQVDPMLGDLRVLMPHQGRLESEAQFTDRIRQETSGAYDDPEAYLPYTKPIEELEKYAAKISDAEINPDQLVLGFRIKRVKAA